MLGELVILTPPVDEIEDPEDPLTLDVTADTPDGKCREINSPAIILIAELSCKDQLLNSAYANKVIEIANKHEKVVGVVCQHAYPGLDNLVTIVPGISTAIKEDSQGQQYMPVSKRNFADIFVVGRAITGCKTIVEMLCKLKEIAQEITLETSQEIFSISQNEYLPADSPYQKFCIYEYP